MEPLKNFFSPTLVKSLGAALKRAEPSFAADKFVKAATKGLTELELLDRGKHIAQVMARHLPQDYPQALDLVLRSLGPEHSADELVGVGMAPFFYLPHTVFVAEQGLNHFDLSLRAQYELTKRFTCEWSIRTFLASDPERTVAQLLVWAQDDNAHVRRLVSEGTRLRLPWAMRVSWLDEHPERVIALLELLKSDPTTLVRRSVANSLNDLSKIYPDLVIETCKRWSSDVSSEMMALVRHALRTLVKKGHRGALALQGAGARPQVVVEGIKLSPKRLRIGEELTFSFRLMSNAPLKKGTRTSKPTANQQLLIDYAVHFVKANGKTAAKVFKLKRVSLEPGQLLELKGLVSFSQMSTRRHYPGKHHIELLINGFAQPLAEFVLLASSL